MLSNKYKRIPLSQITFQRDSRQRSEIDVSDIIDSIRERGVLQAVIVEEQEDGTYLLIAGERRFTASQELNLKDIPARIGKNLTEIERQIIELSENVQRKDLPWPDFVRAVGDIHALFKSANSDHTQEMTAAECNVSRSKITKILAVYDELKEGHDHLLEHTGWIAAYNAIVRRDERQVSDVLNSLMEPEPPKAEPSDAGRARSTISQGSKFSGTIPSAPRDPMSEEVPFPPAIIPPEQSILNTDFHDWATSYEGPRFNLIHCDFPYGVNLHESDQGNVGNRGTYEDSEETFWELIEVLCYNLDRLMTQSAHLMFWFAKEMEQAVLDEFKVKAPSLIPWKFPLIWHKTDNKGILADAKRQPRHVYESCLVFARNDRYIIKAVSDTYGAPKGSSLHQSEKPEPVLRYFMQMFVDENTRMLDPTCGSGTSLRAAESLDAEFVQGIELDPEFAKDAQAQLLKFRNLRVLEQKKKASAA